MEGAQQGVEHGDRGPAGGGARGELGVVGEPALDHLDVPVAEAVPGDVVEPLHHLVEAVAGDRGVAGLDGLGDAGEDPAVLRTQGLGFHLEDRGDRLPVAEPGHQQPGRVPELVREQAVGGDAVLVEAHVLPRCPHRAGPGTDRVGAVALDHVERVDDVALRLAHPRAVTGEDGAVDDHVAEGLRAGEAQPGHDHPRHPQEDDLPRGHQHVGRIEAAQVGGVLGPAEDREGPERAAEPGVEDVGVVTELGAPALRAGGGVHDPGEAVAVAAGRHRDGVAEPELAADAPVADVAHPVEVDGGEAPGVEAHLLGLDDGDRGLGERAHRHPPLLADQRLEHALAAVAVAHGVDVLLLPHHQAELAQRLGHRHPGLVDGQAVEQGELGDVHGAVEGDDADHREAVALADVVVGGVVGRGHLEGAGAELGLHRLVLEDRDLPAGERQDDVAADERGVAGVAGGDGDAGVAEYRLGAHRGDDDLPAALDRVADADEAVGVLLPLDLLVADRRPAARAPVDDPRAAVDETGVVELLEDDTDGTNVGGVEGEASP